MYKVVLELAIVKVKNLCCSKLHFALYISYTKFDLDIVTGAGRGWSAGFLEVWVQEDRGTGGTIALEFARAIDRCRTILKRSIVLVYFCAAIKNSYLSHFPRHLGQFNFSPVSLQTLFLAPWHPSGAEFLCALEKRLETNPSENVYASILLRNL